MLFIGLTGGIGSGKSEALKACERFGAAVLSSDAVVHELLGTEQVRDMVRERWGERVVDDGEVNRGAIAEIVFADPQDLAWLEQTIFPLVGERIGAWHTHLETDGRVSVAVVEVPLLFEAGIEGIFDATIAVVAEEDQRAERAGGRGHLGVAGREGRQLTQADKAARADHLVRNDGTLEELQEQVSTVLEQIRADAAT